MRASLKYLAITTLAILLCSCNKEVTSDIIESQVQISAKITPCVVTRVAEDGTAFTNGDAIKVQNINRENKNLAVYTYSATTGKWTTTDELYWNGESANTFNAWFPADAEYTSFTIPPDQTVGTTAADWMTATASAKKEDGDVELSFNHNLAKVTVFVESWSNEYSANEKIVNSLELNSLSSVMSYDGTLSGDNAAKWIKTYTSQANTSFVAIIAPAIYNADADIMQIYVSGVSTPLKVKTTSSVKIEAGKAYTFKLAIGNNLAEITSSVTVGGWDDEALDDQQATTVIAEKYEYVDEDGNNYGEGVEIDGVVWAPVNCGYHPTDYPYGKLYQWGRKYGQGYSLEYDATEPEIVEGGGSYDRNDNVFYARIDELTTNVWAEADYAQTGNKVSYLPPMDWTNGPNDKFWNLGTESNPIKTEHDPCPAGWRVPTHIELHNAKISLPKAGMRYYDGDASGREGEGYYWSSKPLNRYTPWWSESDYMNDVAYSNGGEAYRVYGYSVRCVLE